MPRCTSTLKFAGVEEGEPEVQEEEIEEGSLSYSVRCVRLCSDCGEEFSEMTFDDQMDVECPKCGSTVEDSNTGEETIIPLEIVSNYVESQDSYQTVNPKTGKPIAPRYQKHFVGFIYTATIKCSKCEQEFTMDAEDSVPASYFESLV